MRHTDDDSDVMHDYDLDPMSVAEEEAAQIENRLFLAYTFIIIALTVTFFISN